ncbi:ATPase family AAA domain-containing protein 2 isoform X2 [Perognathus longimembris pacificus]|uniref:ATPase family AAA domain-containing protein 2 isoform X2 n=1 Tax=Perognathus longimembris pacificus TaxID=214514 RepID=UPI002019F682|nr:ATPase family AAA domain-containing protein 2 isoform X2 [Perognathus longimembris pacificus]
MVVLRSSMELHNHSASSATDSLDLSSEFLSLDFSRRRRLRSATAAEKSAVTAAVAAAGDGSSVKEVETYHQTRSLRSLRKNAQTSSDSGFDKNMEITDKYTHGRHFTRQLARQQAGKKKKGKEDKVIAVTQSMRTRDIVQTTECLHENGDVEVRRSCRIRSRYSSVNQSVLFDKLITNTAEAVLQKMDDMKKMRRQRMKGLEELKANLNVYTRGKQKGIQRADEETTDNQEGSVESSEEGEDQEDEDGEDDEEDEEDDEEDGEEEDNQKRYYLRQRKTTVYYQSPLEKPRHQKKPNIFYSGSASPARPRYRLSSSGPRSPYCKRKNRRRHAIHSSDSTSSSSSEDEQQFERRRKKSCNRAINRCLPLNFRKDEVRGIYKDRMKIGASLADVDPMQLDSSVRFDSVGGLSSHIAALKEMVVFPLLYPEVFEKFKIQPPRGCLFYGPPGTGKTLVARALANECSQGDKRVAFFMRKGADCLSKWVGESERQLRLLFDQAYQMRPSIIFFDEIDGLAPVRSSRQDQIHSSIVSTLLALMDGLDSRGEVVVIGATNRLDSIDPALRRPGRFDREFLFSLPDKDARKEILKIHTRDWNPKPLDMFLEELAENCVGYCGADIKSVCAEAALCALRRRYPQIYTTSEKLQLDLSSINISAKDFEVAMQKMIPASQRAVTSPGQALSAIVKPLLHSTVHKILEALQRVFPHAGIGADKTLDSGVSCPLLESDLAYSDDDVPSVYENGLSQKSYNKAKDNFNFLHLNRNACYQPMSFRPRMLIVGEPGFGQGSHLAPAVIHALEKFTVYTLDIPVLFGVSAISPEETCAQMIREAKRTAPSIVYIPHIHLWWDIVGLTLKATFTALLQNIPSFAPVLLLATSDKPHSALPEEVQELFIHDYGEVFHVQLPGKEERTKFFEDLILKQAAKAPISKKKAVLQALEVLPVAPPPEPKPLTEEELKRLEEQEEDTFRELRIFLRNVTHRLAIDKRFRAFTKPVDPDEVPDYVTVIKEPMDLSSMISKIDLHKYLTVKDYLRDIDLICSNALEYNPDRDPGDRLIRHRACALRDTAYAIIKEELDEDFEQLCEEIQESRKKRGCSSSKYAPSYYHVMPKHSTLPVGDKKSDLEQNEKPKIPRIPVACSTPAQFKRKIHRKSKWHVGTKRKRRRISQAKDDSQNAAHEQVESDTEEIQDTSADLEPGNTGESSVEENEKQQNISKGKIDLRNKSPSNCNNENELEESKKTTACTELRKDKIACNGDAASCQMIDISEESEAKEMCLLRMTRARQSQVEQQRLISVEKALAILSQPTPSLVVDHEQLQDILKTVVKKSEKYNIFQLENLYAVLSQCIYQHREDYDKTTLIQKMEQEIKNFSCSRS